MKLKLKILEPIKEFIKSLKQKYKTEREYKVCIYPDNINKNIDKTAQEAIANKEKQIEEFLIETLCLEFGLCHNPFLLASNLTNIIKKNKIEIERQEIDQLSEKIIIKSFDKEIDSKTFSIKIIWN